MSYLLQILIAEKQSCNAMIKVQSIKWACLGSSWLLPRRLGLASRLGLAILVPDRANCPKIDLALACATLALVPPNLWKLVGVI